MSARPRRVSDIKPLFANLAQTSHYQITFGGLPLELRNYLAKKGVTPAFFAENAGLLCYNASLPSTSFVPKNVDSNFTGINEKFALSRSYSEISLDFYVDSSYLMVKFLESWMEFIASGSHNPIDATTGTASQRDSNYFIRMQYPEYYKSNSTKIIKFDRNYAAEIEYTFIGFWPIAMSPPTISYVQSDVLKVSVSFQYDRYIAGRPLGINPFFGEGSKSIKTSNTSGEGIKDSLVPVRGQSGVVFYDSRTDTRTSAEVNRRFFSATGQPIIN